MIKVISTLKIRNDAAGSGEYNAPRAGRRHKGKDWVVEPGAAVLTPVAGRVTKLGYVYNGDFTHRYVQITCRKGYDHRLMYVYPMIREGEEVEKDQAIIGIAQDISKKYPGLGMTPHIHYAIKDSRGNHINPAAYPGD